MPKRSWNAFRFRFRFGNDFACFENGLGNVSGPILGFKIVSKTILERVFIRYLFRKRFGTDFETILD